MAAGMKYLVESKYVYHNLATRNCLVISRSDSITVKIGDFGMCRNLYSRNYV